MPLINFLLLVSQMFSNFFFFGGGSGTYHILIWREGGGGGGVKDTDRGGGSNYDSYLGGWGGGRSLTYLGHDSLADGLGERFSKGLVLISLESSLLQYQPKTSNFRVLTNGKSSWFVWTNEMLAPRAGIIIRFQFRDEPLASGDEPIGGVILFMLTNGMPEPRTG
jgi:hypothetical protein